MSFLIGFLLVVEVLVCVLLVVSVLMQPSKADSGIGSAFGGQATDAVFGAGSATVLAKITGWLTAIFFALSFLLAILIAKNAHRPSQIEKEIFKTTPAVTTPAEIPALPTEEKKSEPPPPTPSVPPPTEKIEATPAPSPAVPPATP